MSQTDANDVQQIDASQHWAKLNLPEDVKSLLSSAPSVVFPRTREEVLSMAMGGQDEGVYEVAYDTPGHGRVVEATVTKARNGLSVNYPEPYMRRRDPECMTIGDGRPTDKVSFEQRFSRPFDPLRDETFQWLATQDLCVTFFIVGNFAAHDGPGGVLIAPRNAGFFIGGLADLQGMIPADKVASTFQPRTVIYLAPPFRHTTFDGKQVVVHRRQEHLHEIFSYNLYPGPSAKKGVYGVLLSMGEQEEWTTLHASTVEVITPYDNHTVIIHEGASGGGKSEMLEHPHRQEDGRLLAARNPIQGEEFYLSINRFCKLCPVTDDMAMARPDHQRPERLVVSDAENAWFLRVNHITQYGTDTHLERLTIKPPEPLIFLNMDTPPGATCLLWEHQHDAPGRPCPNPRVIVPRHDVPRVLDREVEVHVRSFGIRTPQCTRQNPSYGILGFLQILPPSLAWLWRLVAPRGHANPSITDTQGMTSEGVGSYWPFATGRMVDHANLLLRQIQDTAKTRFVLIPNQHVGAWEVSFMPQWVSREYLARRGTAIFLEGKIGPARCPLLGYAMNHMTVEGTMIPEQLLRVEQQSDVGEEAYDAGATILREFFHRELTKFNVDALDPLGRQIIQACFDNASVHDYEKLLPGLDDLALAEPQS